jgi:protein-L-isoaspartate(D-aspartate) O-methyltransferase
MVDTQVRPSDVTEFPIIDAMLSVPRELFVPRDRMEMAYVSEHVELGDDRVLLDPRVFAKMLDALNLTNSDLVLDLGTGLGYSAAVIARIAEAVVAVEDDADRAAEAQSLLTEHHADNVILETRALVQGAEEHGPYDAIIIQGGVEHIPDTLLAQLKEGGRVVAIFMDNALGTVRVGHKIDGYMSWRFAFNGTAPVLEEFKSTAEFAL